MLRRIAKIIQLIADESYLLDAFLSLSELPLGMIDTFLNLIGHQESLRKVVFRAIEKEALKGSKQALLRENTLAVEVLIHFCVNNSKSFFQHILNNVVHEILQDEDFKDVEVNPIFTEKSIRTSVIKHRQKLLGLYANKILDILVENSSQFPSALRFVFGNLKALLEEQFSEAVQLCGSLFFLRVFNPIILSPENYGITEECPHDHRRGLILLTKILQAAANGVEFDEAKEEYMVPFNEFITSNASKLETLYVNLMTTSTSMEDTFQIARNAEPEQRGLDFLQFLLRNLPMMEKNIQLGHLASRKKNFAKLKKKVENETDHLQVNFGLWGTDQVNFWLTEVLQLPEYCDTFKEEGVDGSVLVELTEEDLISLGIKALGHRKKILRALELLKQPEVLMPLMKCASRNL